MRKRANVSLHKKLDTTIFLTYEEDWNKFQIGPIT